jgi:LuxR family maltose regulon positive regulatory protein
MAYAAADGGSSVAGASAQLTIATKLHFPATEGAVARPRLAGRLSSSDGGRLTLVTASPGAGKSTVLAQWAGRDKGHAFAWLTLDPADNDPVRLWTHVLAALGRAGVPVDDRLLGSARGADRIYGFLPGVVNALAEAGRPVVLVLDDFHVLHDEAVLAEVTYLLHHLPARCRIAVGTRVDPPLPLARLRANGQLCELRDKDLRFRHEEAAELLSRELGAGIGDAAVGTLLARTEGWAVGLYLAVLALRAAADAETAIVGFTGTRRHVVDYFTDEVLADLEPGTREFLLRSAVLGRLTGALCDAVLERRGSARLLETLVSSNRLVVPLDDDREWYRYHRLFADFLQAELRRADPGALPGLHLRASAWYDRAGLPEEAVEHAIASGDTEATGRLIARAVVPLERAGRFMTIAGWLRRLGEDRVAQDPRFAIAAAWVALNLGDTDAAERWLGVTEGCDPAAPFDAWAPVGVVVPMTRAVSAYLRGAPAEAARQAQQSIDAGPPSVWTARASVMAGASLYWRGRVRQARGHFERLLPRLEGESIPVMIALGYLGAIALEEGDAGNARALSVGALEAAERAHISGHLRSATAHLTLCRLYLRNGDAAAARRHIAAELEPMRARLEPAQLALLCLVEARANFQSSGTAAAQALLARAGDLAAQCEEQETIAARLAELEPMFVLSAKAPAVPAARHEQLSGRELDVLRLLMALPSSFIGSPRGTLVLLVL